MNKLYKIIIAVITFFCLAIGYCFFQRSVCTDIQSCVMIQKITINNIEKNINKGIDESHTSIVNDEKSIKDGFNSIAPTKKSFDNIGKTKASGNSRGVSFGSEDILGASIGDKGVGFHTAITPGASITDKQSSVFIPTTILGSGATLSTSGKVSEQEGQPGATKTRTESTGLNKDL